MKKKAVSWHGVTPDLNTVIRAFQHVPWTSAVRFNYKGLIRFPLESAQTKGSHLRNRQNWVVLFRPSFLLFSAEICLWLRAAAIPVPVSLNLPVGAKRGGFLAGGLNAAISFLEQCNGFNGLCCLWGSRHAEGTQTWFSGSSQVPAATWHLCVLVACWSVSCVRTKVAVCWLNIAGCNLLSSFQLRFAWCGACSQGVAWSVPHALFH